jgi:hypothetical protein
MKPADWIALCIVLTATFVLSLWVIGRSISSARQARASLTSGEEYRSLTEEYRRLSDLAITANEHVDLRLTDLSVQVDALRGQLDQMQRILKEVE